MNQQAYKIGENDLKKSLYTITSDNKISSIENQRNGIAENNWQYEYFTNMPGLKNATLNAGSGNTQYDAYSREDFEYDLAGNPYRYKSGTANWSTVSSNKNNQTTQINYASDAVLPIRGKASTSATLNISVDGALQNYTRPSGQENFAFGLNAYTSTRKYHEVKAEAVETDSNTTPPTTIRTMQRGKAYIEATPENFVYDDNGNLASDGRHAYTWNNENRLIAVETNASAAGAGVEKEKFVYEYDWTGRKVKSEHYEYANNAWVLASTNKRYYDDYNLIYETTEYYDGTTPTEVKKYYYGTDLLGSVYGSAGTGGLRMAEIDGETVFALNNQVGSIEALYGADSATAAQARAEYIYSSYGEIMMKSGDLADKNNITYSTRYKEANTGLVSYTYRHYSPRLKKWINKDPIAESGGVNLYQMVGNQPVNCWDLLGCIVCECNSGESKIIYPIHLKELIPLSEDQIDRLKHGRETIDAVNNFSNLSSISAIESSIVRSIFNVVIVFIFDNARSGGSSGEKIVDDVILNKACEYDPKGFKITVYGFVSYCGENKKWGEPQYKSLTVKYKDGLWRVVDAKNDIFNRFEKKYKNP